MLPNFFRLQFRNCHFPIILFFLLPALVHAQQELRGKIYSAKDSTALAAVSVYFDGTSIGTSTNSDGEYQIKRNGSGEVPLVIRFMGYQTVTIEKIPQDLTFLPAIYLQEKQEQLNEVVLQPDPWSREKKLKIFRREFLGLTEEALDVKIENEDALKLYYNPAENVLTVYADEPLLVINKHLGYEIEYNLQLFKAQLGLNNFGGTYTQSVYYEGTSFFKEYKGRKRPFKKHVLHRRDAYFGSSLHFMRALANKKLAENSFSIFHEQKQVPTYEYFEITPRESGAEVKVLKDHLVLVYGNFDQSGLQASEGFLIDRLGNHSPPQAVTFTGKMAYSRIALLLPLDYYPGKHR